MLECKECSKTFVNISNLKRHYNTYNHQQIILRLSANKTIAQQNNSIDTSIENKNNIQSTTDKKKYNCIGCKTKQYNNYSGLFKHHKKCEPYNNILRISQEAGIPIENAEIILREKALKKYNLIDKNTVIANNISIIDTNPIKHKSKSITTNNNNTTNNITINNNILIGDWANINYVRPTNFENLSVLDDDKNKLLLLASGYHAFKKLLDIIYAQPENKNIHIINRKKDYVKILTVDGAVKVVSAATAYDMLIDKLIDIIDAFIDASEPLIKANPIYKAGIDALRKSHNWDGEGNSRYNEYRKYIELIVENIGRQAAINLIRFENDIRQILVNGGQLNFNTQSLRDAELLMDQILAGGSSIINNPESLLTEPTQVEPTQVEPTQVEPTQVEPTQVEPTQVEPTQVEPTQVEPTQVGPTVV